MESAKLDLQYCMKFLLGMGGIQNLPQLRSSWICTVQSIQQSIHGLVHTYYKLMAQELLTQELTIHHSLRSQCNQ
jgi:hypothetical protein